MADIFISYKRRMRQEVACLAEVLRALRLTVWFDAGLEPGSSFSAEIAAEVRAARVVLVAWTPDCFPRGGDASGWVIGEASIGRERQKRGEGGYAPTFLEPCELDPPFNTDHVESLIGWFVREGQAARHGSLTDPRFLAVLGVIGRHTGRPGLSDFVRARSGGDAAALKRWAQSHSDDPLAEDAWAEVERMEAEALKVKLAAEREKRLEREEVKPALDWRATATTSSILPAPPPEPSPSTGRGRTIALISAGAVALALLVAVLIWQPWRGNELPSAQPASVSESVIVSDSGLRLEWLARGADQTLARPSAQANVRVFYEGSLADGTVFDSNFGREAVSLPLPHMVPGFAEAVQAMRPGDEVLAEFPPELGYGAEGAPSGGIPPSARLRFRIFLESFEEPGGTGPATAPSAAAPPSEPVIGDKNRASGPNEAIVRPEMVRIPGRNFEVGRYEVTFAEWDACVAAGGCNGYRPNDQGWGRGNRPVINVSWNDAQAYVQWLSQRTEQRYRLPTSAEWEYAARAGSTTNFWWGDQDPVCDQGARNGAIFDGCIDNRARTRVVGSFQPNGFGLYDVHGNVWEWVEDSEGSSRVLRGGSWSNDPRYLRSASQYSFNPTVRFNNYGFRVARTV